MVSATDRNPDRHFDLLHGAGEYRRRTAEASVDHLLHVRPCAWLRLFLRFEANAAVRGLTSADVAAFVQYRSRTRAIVRARACRAGARSSVPLCGGGTDGHDHSFRDRRPHGLALDGRPLRSAAAIPLAHTYGGRPCER